MSKKVPAITITFTILLLNTILVLANKSPSQKSFATQVIEISAVDSGWYSDSGSHTPDLTNYVTGECYLNCQKPVEFRSFFVFDLSAISDEILSASLVIENPPGGYISNDPTERLGIFEVSTPITSLITGEYHLAKTFNDLGSGPMFGNVIVSPASKLVEIDINQTGIAALNDGVGEHFAFGGAITTFDGSKNNEWVFGNANQSNIRKLVLTVDSPLTMTANYPGGAPGSYLNISGGGFPPNQVGRITINSFELAPLTIDDQGGFTVTIATIDADIGYYYVTVEVNPSATVEFILSNDLPLRSREGDYDIYEVPAGIAYTDRIMLPLIIR